MVCYAVLISVENEALVSKSGQPCLHERTMILCALADSTIGATCRSIRTGDISMKELDGIAIPARVRLLEKLCSAAGEDGIQEAVNEKLDAANAFNRHRETLGLICSHIVGVHVKGVCTFNYSGILNAFFLSRSR